MDLFAKKLFLRAFPTFEIDVNIDGAGIYDSGAGIIDSGARIIDSGAGIIDSGAGIIDSGAGIYDSGAGIIDSGDPPKMFASSSSLTGLLG